MPTYVSLLNWTDQGIRNVKETLQRADSASEPCPEARGQLAGLLDRKSLRPCLPHRSPRRRERYRLPLGGLLGRQHQDYYATCIRPRRDEWHSRKTWLTLG
jgi:hypothetical protein